MEKKKEGIYYRTCIHGKGLEEIPVKCERKKVQPRRQIKDALTTRIKVVPKACRLLLWSRIRWKS